MNHNKTVYVPHHLEPTNADQIRVRPRQLYPFVTDGDGYFKEWADSLRCMADDPGNSMMGYRVFDFGYTVLYLNLNLAMFLIIGSSFRATGAVARVILDEGLQAAASGDFDYINRALEKYERMVKFAGYVQASTLFSFLCGGNNFDDWLNGHKKHLRIRCGRDYFRIHGIRRYWRENGPGELHFDEFTARRVIMATPTPRGKLASTYLQP